MTVSEFKEEVSKLLKSVGYYGGELSQRLDNLKDSEIEEAIKEGKSPEDFV